MKLDNALISILNSTIVLLATAAAIPSVNDDKATTVTVSMLEEMVDVYIEEYKDLQRRLASTRKRRSTTNSMKKRRMVQ